MAIIRQKRQYINQPIGVIRADLGGQQVSRAIGDMADSLIQGSFKALVEDAQTKGSEEALSVTSEKLRTINPETGMPEAFSPPPQFGRAASRAYQSVVERRYVSDTEADLKAESARIYAETKDKPNGFQEYSSRMRDYAENISESALPRFKNIVKGVSSSLVASTEVNFITQKAERDREFESFKLQESADNDTTNIIGMVSSTDFSDKGQFNEFVSYTEGVLQAQRNGLNAGIYDGPIYSQQENKVIKAISNGISQKIYGIYLKSQSDPNRKPLTLADVKQAEIVLNAGGKNIDSVDDRLRPIVEKSSSFSFNLTDRDGNQVTRNLTGPVRKSIGADLVALYQDINAQNIQADTLASEQDKNDRMSFELGLFGGGPDGGINQSVESIDNLIASGDIEGAISTANAKISSIESDGIKFGSARDTIVKGQNQILKGLTNSLTDRLYQVTVTETVNGQQISRTVNASESRLIADYINEQGAVTLDMLPEEAQPIAKALLNQITPSIRDYARRQINAKDTDVQQAATANKRNADRITNLSKTFNGVGGNTKQEREDMDMAMGIPPTPNFFLTQEGIEKMPELYSQYITTGHVGESLKNTAEYIAGGGARVSGQELINFMLIYDSMRNEAANLGHTVSPWDRSLSADDVAFLDTINQVMKVEGTANAPEVYSRMTEALAPQNAVKFSDRMIQVTGSKSGSGFVSDIVGSNNLGARAYFEPLVKYYVAGGLGAKKIKSLVQNNLNREFVNTEGYVVDPSGSDTIGGIFKSRFGWAKFIPNYNDRITAVRNINAYFAEKGIKAYIPRQERTFTELSPLFGMSVQDMDILDRADAGTDPNAQAVYLYPMRGKGEGMGDDVVYQVVVVDEKGMSPFMHTQTVIEGGREIEVTRPIYLNMRDIKASINTDAQDYSEEGLRLDMFNTGDPAIDDLNMLNRRFP